MCNCRSDGVSSVREVGAAGTHVVKRVYSVAYVGQHSAYLICVVFEISTSLVVQA